MKYKKRETFHQLYGNYIEAVAYTHVKRQELPVVNTPESLVIWRLESRPSETDEDRDGLDRGGRALGFLWRDTDSKNDVRRKQRPGFDYQQATVKIGKSV